MKGRVILTDDLNYELNKINKYSEGYGRKFYVYGKKCPNIDTIKDSLPDYTFVPLERTMDPVNISMFMDNSENDFFVLKYPRLNDIMDRNIDMHQTALKGYKLVVEEHPFLTKRDVYWCYFLWSFFDKSLLGYPHCYAFQGAKSVGDVNPYDCSMLAKKVAVSTDTSLQEVFHDDIIVKRIELSEGIKKDYQVYKKQLFETESSPIILTRKLKKFINDRIPDLKKGFNSSYLFRVYGQYKSGERTLVVSDAKVDDLLEKEFFKYINNVNEFVRTLWDATRT